MTHWNTSWGSSEPQAIGLRPCPPSQKGRRRNRIRGALQTCGYPNWTFIRTSKRSRADKKMEMHNNIIIPYVAGISEKLKRIFNKHIRVRFKPSNAARQKLVHPEDKTPKHKHSNVIHAVQCSRADLYIWETKPLHK